MPNKKTKREYIDIGNGKKELCRTEMREKALTLLAEDRPRNEIASKCQISLSTLYRWMEEPKFKQLIEKRRQQIAFDVIQSSASTINEAAQVVKMAILGELEDKDRAKLAFDVLKETGALRTTGTAIGMEAKNQGNADGGGVSVVINLAGDGGEGKVLDADSVEILESDKE